MVERLQRHAFRMRMTAVLVTVAASLGVSAVATSTASAATGSYTLTTFPTPTLSTEDTLIDGQTISPPAGVPSTATITGVSISLTVEHL